MPPKTTPNESTRGAGRPATRPVGSQLGDPKPATPSRRASSAGPPSSNRPILRTPREQARTPGARLGSARRPIVVTPHGRAAQRELNLRRAGLTPRDRRKSGIQQRATPRDTLRQLSRLLAPVTQPIIPTPEVSKGNIKDKKPAQDDGSDDGPELKRPRFSLPMGDEDDDDEDDSLLEPPRSQALEIDNYTGNSIELPRRAASERPPGRYSRGSFGSVRMSDAFADLNDMRYGGDMQESSYLVGRDYDDEYDGSDDNNVLAGENTQTLRGFDFARNRSSTGRESDIRPAGFSADDTTTEFVFNVPQRDLSEEEPEEPDEPDAPDERNELDEPEAELSPHMETTELGEADVQNEVGELENNENIQFDDSIDDDVEEAPNFEAEDEEEQVNLNSLNDKEPDVSMLAPSLHDTTQDLNGFATQKSNTTRRKVKVSKHGIQCPSLPAGVVKKLAMNFARTAGNSKAKIGKETLDAVMQASDWFFEQVSDDLGAYANHAGRKTIDESDVVTLMARQRQTNATTTPFSLAQRYLPRELLQELRMVPPSKLRKGRQLESVEEDDEED